MPKVGSPNRAFRMVDIGLWERFGAIARPNRSTVLREFIAWYLREPKAKLPARPSRIVTRSDDSDHGGQTTTVRA